jgi:hypothetical protein
MSGHLLPQKDNESFDFARIDMTLKTWYNNVQLAERRPR